MRSFQGMYVLGVAWALASLGICILVHSFLPFLVFLLIYVLLVCGRLVRDAYQ